MDKAAFALSLDLPDEAATAAFAEDVAACLAVGHMVTLSGGLGTGKTTFARALLRALADDPALEVPSPTFTLVQAYATSCLTVSHFDLYRLSSRRELDEIGFADAAMDGAVLVEWPERAGDRLPVERLDIAFEIAGRGRRVTVTGNGPLPVKLTRSRAARALLDRAGWQHATRRHLHGDASTRTYERIHAEDRRAVLMDWPARGQLPAGDTRSRFRARDVRAFVAVGEALRTAGLSAPEIYGADMATGLLLLEDFGTDGLVVDGRPDAERYHRAMEALAAIHSVTRSDVLPLPDGSTHRLPPLSADALTVDIELFAEWYVPHSNGSPLSDAARIEFAAIWQTLIARLSGAEKNWVLFDMQSPNLFWLADRPDVAAVGLIDFQDMFFGPSAYDVASLAQDARVTVPASLEAELGARYVALRRAADPVFDEEGFRTVYAILAAARAMKNMGVFSRLAATGNPNYLKHLPRLREYLDRSFADAVLSALAVWYERHLPH